VISKGGFMGKIKIEYYILFFLVICFLTFYYFSNSCSIERDLQKIETILPKDEVETVLESTPIIIDFGNGVKYFPFTGKEFGKKLSEFLGNNTNLEEKVVAPDDFNSYGIIKGYFITFREKK
jgi:hypothetical protein